MIQPVVLQPGDQIYRYEVPVDDQWHEHWLFGDPLCVGCRRVDVVEFWAVASLDRQAVPRWFTVAGTGNPVLGGTYRGTAVHGPRVWHLIERIP